MTQITKTKSKADSSVHIPVLLHEVLAVLAPQKGETYLDVTAGYAGHARAVLEHTENQKGMTLVDRDKNAIAVLEQELPDAEIVHNDFLSASQDLLDAGRGFDAILADLGVSSPHLNDGERGFAFSIDGPLDMRMDRSQDLTAADVVNTYSEAELTDIIRRYGEEPRARKVASLIVEHRPFSRTGELAEVIKRAYPRHHKTHPATRSFQALRIAVNDELRLVEQAIPIWLKLLNPGGRLAIISFHSLEDRIVKDTFREVAGDRYDANYRLLTKKPLVASEHELVFNPRARSSKLRAVAKIKTKEREGPNANSG